MFVVGMLTNATQTRCTVGQFSLTGYTCIYSTCTNVLVEHTIDKFLQNFRTIFDAITCQQIVHFDYIKVTYPLSKMANLQQIFLV